MTTITPDLLAEWRKNAEHARDNRLILSDVNGAVVLALLDALHEARVAYLRLHQHDLQIACNEREALRARVNELENPRPISMVLTRDRFLVLGREDSEALRNGGDR